MPAGAKGRGVFVKGGADCADFLGNGHLASSYGSHVVRVKVALDRTTVYPYTDCSQQHRAVKQALEAKQLASTYVIAVVIAVYVVVLTQAALKKWPALNPKHAEERFRRIEQRLGGVAEASQELSEMTQELSRIGEIGERLGRLEAHASHITQVAFTSNAFAQAKLLTEQFGLTPAPRYAGAAWATASQFWELYFETTDAAYSKPGIIRVIATREFGIVLIPHVSPEKRKEI